MLHLIIGGAGTGKSTLLREEMHAAHAAGQRVFAIVPEQFSFAFEVTLYHTLGAAVFNSLAVHSFTSLAASIFEQYGGRSGQYADDLTKTILLHEVINKLLQQKQLRYFSRQAGKPAFLASSRKLISELRKAGISPAVLTERSATFSDRLREKATDIALLYAAYDQALTAHGRKDNLTDITESAAIANGQNHFRGVTVFLDEFDSFTGDQLEMLAVLLAESKEVYLTLRTEAVAQNDSISVFSTCSKTAHQLIAIADKFHIPHDILPCTTAYRFQYPELALLNQNVLRVQKPVPSIPASHIHIIEAKNCYTEVDYACAAIRALVTEQQVAFRDIVIVTHQLSDYTGILEAACARYEIPCELDGGHGVMHTAIMQLLSAVLRLISTKSPKTEDVLRYAKTQLLGISCARIARLEAYCYTWNIEGTLWLSPFPVAPEDDAEVLRNLLIAPIVALREDCHDTSGAAICKRLYDFLQEMEVPSHISGVARTYRDNGYNDAAVAIKRIWGNLMDLLDTLAETIGDAPISIAQFRDLFLLLLQQIRNNAPPQSLDAVLIAPVETARLNAPRYTFVLGMNEGYFPSEVRTAGLFSEEDKRSLSLAGLSLSRSVEDLLADERLIAYKTLSSASEGLYLLYPLADESGSPRNPSFLVDEIRAMFPNELRTYAEQADAIFYASTPKAAYDRLVQGYHQNTVEQASVREALAADPVYGARLAALACMDPHPIHHISDPGLIRAISGTTLALSATRFETMQLCPFQDYLQNTLRISQPGKKEINALEIGNIVHACLEQLFAACPDKAAFIALTAEEIAALVQSYALQYLNEKLGGSFGKTERFRKNYQRIINGIPALVQHLQEELQQSAFRPVGVEVTIDKHSKTKPITLQTADGIELILNGKVDRVDLYEADGKRYIRIIDYKNGNKNIELGKLLYGVNMQMLLYLFSLTAPTGEYADATPAGVLYMPISALDCHRKRDEKKAIDSYINTHYQMRGLLLRESHVLAAIEPALAGVYIPTPPTESDDIASQTTSFLSEQQLSALCKHAKELMIQATEKLYHGEIEASPLLGESTCPCTYCGYHAICGDPPEEQCRKIGADAAEQLLKKLNEEENEDA